MLEPAVVIALAGALVIAVALVLYELRRMNQLLRLRAALDNAAAAARPHDIGVIVHKLERAIAAGDSDLALMWLARLEAAYGHPRPVRA